MNAAIRAVVRTGLYNDLEVYGIMRGYAGMIETILFVWKVSQCSQYHSTGGKLL